MPLPFRISDESGDKKYFTIIPNIVINHSTHWEQAIYLVMKRLAGEGSTCYASQLTLAKNAGISQPTVSRTIKKLVKRGWIKLIGTRKGKTRPVKEYKIVDIWKENVDNYEKKYSGGINLLGRDSETREYKKYSERIQKKNPIKEDIRRRELTPSASGIKILSKRMKTLGLK